MHFAHRITNLPKEYLSRSIMAWCGTSVSPTQLTPEMEKPFAVDRALTRPTFNECEECGVEFDEDKNITRYAGGDGVVRCKQCDAARLHPALKGGHV